MGDDEPEIFKKESNAQYCSGNHLREIGAASRVDV
jgi:hypothetical protein